MTPVHLPVTVPVAGVSFRQRDVLTCREGQPVQLRRDPGNPFDTLAVAILTVDGRLLGHLHRALARRFADAGGQAWDGQIAEVLPGQTFGLRVTVTAASTLGPLPVDWHQRGPAFRDDDTAPAGPDPQPEVEHCAYSPSGRLLGQVLARDGDTVLVRTGAGRQARYPAAAVRLRPQPGTAA